jgi:hypothetical protein
VSQPLISPLPLAGARAALQRRLAQGPIEDLDHVLNQFQVFATAGADFEIHYRTPIHVYLLRVPTRHTLTDTYAVALQASAAGTQARLEPRYQLRQRVLLATECLAGLGLVLAGLQVARSPQGAPLALGLAVLSGLSMAALIQRLWGSQRRVKKFLAQTLVARW